MMLLLKGGRIVCPLSGTDALGDVLVDGDRIVGVGVVDAPSAAEIIDCTGCIVAPGFVDLDVTLGDPGQAWREGLSSGSKIAAAGGFTTIVINPMTDPVIDLPAVVSELIPRAASAPGARVKIGGALTRGLAGENLSEVGLLIEAGCVLLSDGGQVISDTRILRRVLEYAAPMGVPVLLRPGNVALEEGGFMHEGRISSRIGLRGIPSAAEEIGVARAIALVRLSGTRVHLSHLTTARGLKMLAEAQSDGLPITASTPARSLVLTDAYIEHSVYDTAARLTPPLRPESDRAALCKGAVERLCVGADHVPWSRVEKELEFAYARSGANGLETAAAAAFTALRGDAMALVSALSVRPAGVLGMKPMIAAGSLADLVIFDPDSSWTVASDWRSRGVCDPLKGSTLSGQIRATIVGGSPIFEC
jgi:dihydroorotase